MGSDNPAAKKNKPKTNLFKSLQQSFIKPSRDILDTCDYQKLDGYRQKMIRGVIRLTDMNVRDIMIPRVDLFAVDAETDLKTLVRIVCKAGHSRVPVYSESIDSIVGILYVKDLLKLLIEKPRRKFQLKKILHEPYFVPETMALDEMLREFKFRKRHIAVVVDEYGGTSGVVTLEDILEEIVGEINDEFDHAEPPVIEKIGRNNYEIDPRMSIADFNEYLGLDLSPEGFDTIGGYVLHLFGKIPDRGESVKDGPLQFTVKDITGTVINRISVAIAKKPYR